MGNGGEAKSYDGEKAWSSINHSIFSDMQRVLSDHGAISPTWLAFSPNDLADFSREHTVYLCLSPRPEYKFSLSLVPLPFFRAITDKCIRDLTK